MFCQKCGASAPEESKFCKQCGHKLKTESRISNKAMLLAAIAALISVGSSLLAFLPRDKPIKAQSETPITEASPSPSPITTSKPIVAIATPKPTQKPTQTPEPEEDSEPEPTPRPQKPRPEPRTKTQTIASGSHTIDAGRFFAFPINIGDWTNPVVTGYFKAAGGMRNNIEIYIVDEDGLTNRKNGNSASTYYNAGRATTGRIYAKLPSLRPDRYYLVVDNSFAIMLPRTVTLYASITYFE